MEIFFPKCSTFVQEIATASLQTMIEKKYNQSQRRKNKMRPVTAYLAARQLSFSYFVLKMNSFATTVKPKNTCKFKKLKLFFCHLQKLRIIIQLRRVQITPKTSTNITRYLTYSRGSVRQVFSQRASAEFDSSYERNFFLSKGISFLRFFLDRNMKVKNLN